MVSLSVLELSYPGGDDSHAHSKKADKLGIVIQQALSRIKKAYNLNQSNPIALNHLANHYFWKWDELAGTANVSKGSDTLVTSEDLRSKIQPNDTIKIGSGKGYITVVGASRKCAEQGKVEFSLQDKYAGKDGFGVPIFKKNYETMLELANKAIDNTDVPEVQAESYFLMGRAWHAKGDMQKAYQYYYQAHQLWPTYSLAQYGMAQLLLEQNMPERAMPIFEDVLKTCPESPETLSVLASLCAKEKVTVFHREIEGDAKRVCVCICCNSREIRRWNI